MAYDDLRIGMEVYIKENLKNGKIYGCTVFTNLMHTGKVTIKNTRDNNYFTIIENKLPFLYSYEMVDWDKTEELNKPEITFDDLRIGMKVSVNTSLREKISTITEGDPYHELFKIDGYNGWFSVKDINDINIEKTKELNRTTLSKEAEKLKESVKNFEKLNDTINESLEMLKKRKECTDKKIEQLEEITADIPDAIKPNHYKMNINGIDIETRDIMQAVATEEEYNGFLYCNVIKYVLRAKRKNGIEDMKKAKLYLEWLIAEKER